MGNIELTRKLKRTEAVEQRASKSQLGRRFGRFALAALVSAGLAAETTAQGATRPHKVGPEAIDSALASSPTKKTGNIINKYTKKIAQDILNIYHNRGPGISLTTTELQMFKVPEKEISILIHSKQNPATIGADFYLNAVFIQEPGGVLSTDKVRGISVSEKGGYTELGITRGTPTKGYTIEGVYFNQARHHKAIAAAQYPLPGENTLTVAEAREFGAQILTVTNDAINRDTAVYLYNTPAFSPTPGAKIPNIQLY